jgi:hypothetical protein
MRKLLSLLFLLFGFNVFSQNVIPCVTDELYIKSVEANPAIKIEEERGNQLAREFASKFNLAKKGTVIYVPVVFHVIHKNSFENITQAQINDCIRILNEDFRKMAGTPGGVSTDPRSADAEIEFRLAQFDPNGNPTDGVNRILNATETDNAKDQTKALSYWDSNKYFNVWVVNFINNDGGQPGSLILGYAQFPNTRSFKPTTDGILLRADQVGKIGLGQSSQAGRTVTHEAGHWCGLYHPFQDGCVGGTSNNCSSQGDRVCDTPPVAEPSNGCPSITQNTCSNDTPDLPDNIKNYMDYVDGTCMDMFTSGQVTRMKSQMQTFRANIYSSTNLSAAGINADGTYKTLTPSTIKTPFSVVFSESSPKFIIENFMNPVNGWAINNQVGFNDNNCMYINSFANGSSSVLNTRDAFHTVNVDISSLTKPTLTFKIAHAKRVSASSDVLNMFVSDNYGRTEILAKTFQASEMETGDVNSTSAFVPTAQQWKTLSLSLNDYKTYKNFRVRFELQSRRGNNTYIDNILIGEESVSVNELNGFSNARISPNPTNNHLSNFTFNIENKAVIKVDLIDLSGKLIKNIAEKEYQAGEQSIELLGNELSRGIYFIKVSQNQKTQTFKWVIN